MNGNRNVEIRKRTITVWLIIGAMVVVGSFAIVPNTGQPTTDELNKKAILLGSAVSLNPLIIDEGTEITATGAASLGTTVTHNDEAVINFMGDVGEDVITKLKIKNFSPAKITAIVRIQTTENVLASLDDTGSTFTIVRLVDADKWLVQFSQTNGNSDTLAVRIAAISPGVHKVTVQIAPTND